MIIAATVLAAAICAPGEARADDAAAIVIDSTLFQSPADRDRIADSAGGGVELRFLPDDEMMTGSIGGFAAIGQRDGGKTQRDVYDFHFSIGIKPEDTDDKMAIPFAALGLNVLSITTRTKTETMRGTTLGISAQAGVMGHIGDRLIYRASATYLGAIVPGSGDALGGLALQVGLGWVFDS
jgi:hypothetical protein